MLLLVNRGFILARPAMLKQLAEPLELTKQVAVPSNKGKCKGGPELSKLVGPAPEVTLTDQPLPREEG